MSYILMNYAQRIAPGIAALLALIWLFRKRPAPDVRLVVYILLFVLVRDAMVPGGLWHVGTFPVLWMRFNRNPWLLLGLGAITAAMAWAVQRFEPELARLVVWRGKSVPKTLGLGFLAGLLVGAPALIMGIFVPAWVRGGVLPLALWPSVLWISLSGNFLEELLFRGYLQAWLERELTPARAVWGSAIAFAAFHAFLAAQLGGTAGLLLIVFTFYEGLICAWIRKQEGVLASALAHGLGIFLISSGLPA
jgi:membrane protease YdiL (CAAX protease family)